MNIHDLALKSGVGLGTLRKLERLGVLKVDATQSDAAAPIVLHLSRNSRLTVAHMIQLMQRPELLTELRRYEKRARAQIAALGPVDDTLAPRVLAHQIGEAANGEESAVQALVDYIQEAAPGGDVPYHFFAVRIALAQYESQRAATLKSLNLAFAKARAHPAMKNWWRREGREIIYRRPLDL